MAQRRTAMLTDEDVEKIACSVFAKLVARWEERSAEVQKRKSEKEEQTRAKKEDRAKRSKVRLKMIASLEEANKQFGRPVFEYEWRAKFADIHHTLPGALRVAFSRHREALIQSGEVIDENGRFSIALQ
jgi:hypothetical protein